MRVLVVDDDPAIARAFERRLGRRGATVDKAISVAVARFLLEGSLDPQTAWPYDAVLSDVDMPGGTGFDLVAWMTEREYPVKAVLMTADSSPERRERARRLGVRLLDKVDEQDEILAICVVEGSLTTIGD